MSAHGKPIAPGLTREHGGPDAAGVPEHDFSTNSNACGPCPSAWHAVQRADVTRYPDAQYQQLRALLAQHHGVDGSRVVLAGSASEFIFRFTAWAARQGVRQVELPRQAYGDYAHAAQAWGLVTLRYADSGRLDPAPGADPAADGVPSLWPPTPRLRWACDPSSPLGQGVSAGVFQGCDIAVLDRAYQPLRLSGSSAWDEARLQRVWQLFSPNKALGLTGVRGAYALAPEGGEEAAQALAALCPSWPLGAQGVALLQAWCLPETEAWLVESRATLRQWKARQQALFRDRGWTVRASQANFFCVRVPPEWAPALPLWRQAGVKLRDAHSLGLPGHWRVGVLPPASQAALQALLQQGPPPVSSGSHPSKSSP